MASSCPFCGASLNFGLKFCVVCGRHTTAALNKMGGALLRGGRQADSTSRIDDPMPVIEPKNAKKSNLRFRHVLTLYQTLFYGFIAGILFFCAIHFVLEETVPGTIHRAISPLIEPLLRLKQQQFNLSKLIDNVQNSVNSSSKPSAKHQHKAHRHRIKKAASD